MVPSVDPSAPATPRFHAWLEHQLASDLELPLLPDVAARIVAMCDDDDTEARDVQCALEQDPSLASNFLRIANSAMYASRDPIVSLKQAVSRLGLIATRGIALSASVRGRVFQVPGHEASVRAIWQHSVVAAAFAREIARSLRSNVEGAFLCALLHDVGRPIVLQAALAAPESVMRKPIPAALLASAMDDLHAVVGGRAIRAWKLADWTAAAVEHHHRPERAAPFEDEARVTRLADLMAHWAIDGDARFEAFPMGDPVVAELELYREQIDALLALRPAVLETAQALA